MTIPDTLTTTENQIPNREEIVRSLVGFMIETDTFERQSSVYCIPAFRGTKPHDIPETNFVLSQSLALISGMLKDLNGIYLPVRIGLNGAQQTVRAVGFYGLSEGRTGYHAWEIAMPPGQDTVGHAVLDQSVLFGLTEKDFPNL